jgi:Tfp pilus assembly protein PilF
MKMKKLLLILMLLSSGIITFSQQASEKRMPVTTNSKSALTLYYQAKKYLDDVKLDKALGTFNKALVQDPDFFMANYQLAFYFLLNQANDDFDRYAGAAVNCHARLSESEELLKDALTRLRQGTTNVTNIGKKLVEMYPYDSESYNNLAYFQSLAGDSTGMVETLSKAIKIATNPAPFYNQLGYAYLTLKQNDKAEEAFDKYIELDPENPNVYDSKGDYYMFIRKFDRAYDSYMRACSIDSSFSRSKAEMAKQLYEKTEGKKLQIITI